MIGTDIIDKRRIASQWEKYGLQFAKRVLHTDELQKLSFIHDKNRFIAVRWAAKEAFGKALGTGLRSPVLMPNIQIQKTEMGAPFLTVSPEIEHLLKGKHVYLTLSDEKNYVVAFVLIQ